MHTPIENPAIYKEALRPLRSLLEKRLKYNREILNEEQERCRHAPLAGISRTAIKAGLDVSIDDLMIRSISSILIGNDRTTYDIEEKQIANQARSLREKRHDAIENLIGILGEEMNGSIRPATIGIEALIALLRDISIKDI